MTNIVLFMHRGGISLTVVGENMDSVAKPVMRTDMVLITAEKQPVLLDVFRTVSTFLQCFISFP